MRPILTAIALIAALPAAAQEITLGDITITRPALRATPPAAPAAAGYLTIRNDGETADTLTGADIDPSVAGMVQLHQMRLDDGVMNMSDLTEGILLPPGATVDLVPGGLHLMLMQMAQPLQPGQTHDVTLTFEKAGEVTVAMPVLTLEEIRERAEDALED
jgi:copper(I)-binding protein